MRAKIVRFLLGQALLLLMLNLVLHCSSGDTVHVVIEARDVYNQHRIVGGDFWFATLQSDKSPKASVAGKVT